MNVYRLIVDEDDFSRYLKSGAIVFNYKLNRDYKNFKEYSEIVSQEFVNSKDIKNFLNGLSRIKKGDLLYLVTDSSLAIGTAKEDGKFNDGFDVSFDFKKLDRNNIPEEVRRSLGGHIFRKINAEGIFEKSLDLTKTTGAVVPKQYSYLVLKEEEKKPHFKKKIKKENENMAELVIEVHPPEEEVADISISMSSKLPKVVERPMLPKTEEKNLAKIIFDCQISMAELMFKTYIDILENFTKKL